MKAPPAAEQPWISGKTFGDQSPYAGFALRAEPGHTARNTGQFALWEKLKSSKLGRAFSKTGGKTNTFPQIIYILLALIGFAWVAMGAMDNWKGSRWVVNLILSLLFWLPGLIHAIVVMPHYY